ncbi:hypothetical protein HYH02_013458 [Chlamydomonas schloesseri]|uniref:Uncharacterized protein n=1 Tax=Chlamydomonas schloesseri TaxID=2026947 RepID=A0A835T226_9CHLO|nr:hypothetical protein HYH02_013458 [Chlamydomonas schloesseri]|eukprot:KAG2431025.1 hypothetical protein HYH02_013458 [Chlamydomonas schloesseri]
MRCRRASEKHIISALPALVVSALIKTGRSYTLRNVVPAVLAEVLRSQPPDHPLQGIKVLQLNGLDVRREAGAAVLLYDLLRLVVRWAATAGVPVKAAAWREALEVLADDTGSPGMCMRAGSALVAVLHGFEAPVLVLLDELQALLQPTVPRGGEQPLGVEGAGYIRDNVLRAILVDSPPSMLLAVTGSSMALVWTALGAMPVNGVAPLYQVHQVDLPSKSPPGAMERLLEHSLQRWRLQQHRKQVLRLLERAGDSPALFMTMVDRWDAAARPKNTDAFADAYIRSKLFREAQKEWMLGLAHWTDADRGRLLDMADPLIGADFEQDGIVDPSLWRFLRPNLKKTYSGRYYLADFTQRQLLRAVIDRGGKLRKSWTGLVGPGLTLAQLDFGWLLLHLGEVADYLLGLRRRPDINPDRIRGVKRLGKLLQDLATKAEEKLPPGDSVADRWEALNAFKQVLDSPYNAGSRRWYQDEGRGRKLKSHRDLLVFFLRPSDRRKRVAVNTVMALPALLDMPVLELAEQVRSGMSRLAPVTIKDAAAAADAEDEEWEEFEEGEDEDEYEEELEEDEWEELEAWGGGEKGSGRGGRAGGAATVCAIFGGRSANRSGCQISSSPWPPLSAPTLGRRSGPVAIRRTATAGVLLRANAHIHRVRVTAAYQAPPLIM